MRNKEIRNFLIVLFGLTAFAMAAKAPKTAAEYYSDASFQYIENRLPTAKITCQEGLSYYPDDAKLQMLSDRIDESKNEQKNQNRQNNPNGEKNQDQKDQNQQNQDQQNQDQQNNGSSSSENGSSNSENQNQNDQNQQNSNGNSSNSDQSDGNDSSESNANSSDSNRGEQPEQSPSQMSPQEASQLLKDFDEEHGERKPWKPVRGIARPEKDW